MKIFPCRMIQTPDTVVVMAKCRKAASSSTSPSSFRFTHGLSSPHIELGQGSGTSIPTHAD